MSNKKTKYPPLSVAYNIGGTSSAWECVERCFKRYQADPSRATKKTLRGAIENLNVWSVELLKSIKVRGT